MIRATGYIAGFFLLVLMLLTVCDTLLRAVFNAPILGGMEICESAMLILGAFAIVYCAYEKGHVTVDILVSKLSPKGQGIVEIIGYVLCLVLVIPMTLVYIPEAMIKWRLSEVSTVLRIPDFPFYIVIVIGFTMFCLVILNAIIETVKRMKENE